MFQNVSRQYHFTPGKRNDRSVYETKLSEKSLKKPFRVKIGNTNFSCFLIFHQNIRVFFCMFLSKKVKYWF